MAVITGIYTAIMAMLPFMKDTSFSDLTISFEVWILFGIFIIVNSETAKESALKCFVFFLISQPLVYLIQDLINGSQLFVTYYRNWVLWTVACLPMGYIGHYMKKDKWWGLIILLPIMGFLGLHLNGYFAQSLFSFPRHLLTTLFCIVSLIVYPIVIFKDKRIRITGAVNGGIISIACIIMSLISPLIYSTDLLADGEDYHFDDTYKVYLVDDSFGTLSLKYEKAIECWIIHADFKKAGKTEFVLESPDGEKKTFDIEVSIDNYNIEEKHEQDYMGRGITVICNCQKEGRDFLLGIGLLYDATHKDIIRDIKKGKYGEEYKNIAESIKNIAINARRYLYYCKKCGNIEDCHKMDLYAPKNEKVAKECPWYVMW